MARSALSPRTRKRAALREPAWEYRRPRFPGKDPDPWRDGDHLVPDDRGSCKGPPPDCRRIVIRLRSGIKGRCWPQGNEHR
jgi:hypothetical protein